MSYPTLKPLTTDGKINKINDFRYQLKSYLKMMDYRSVRLPELDDSQFSDIHKGMWEFWGMDDAELSKYQMVARNPALDVKNYNVAIDFGTSSTVVAVEENGRPSLFRIGVKDFNEPPQASHFENPTVLEFIDYAKFIDAWQSKAYRPDVDWNDVKCSHEAQADFRNNQGEPHLVASILPKMKQWALREANNERLKIIDSAHQHLETLAPLALRNPVKGAVLSVSKEDPFDPIELYAWFLGMTINWRARGIYLRYFMTFPVAYPKAVKEKILASFRRGLMRSMPETLIKQDMFHKRFEVRERASEPAAYAASALQAFNIAPTNEGEAYAVFDFGGGTTDFDYGYYRLPTTDESEQDDNVESVLAHVGNEGDKFLGGENLLEHLAYRTFLHNLDTCRTENIVFTAPLDAVQPIGTERIIEASQLAQTNTIMLMARLRKFWETGVYDNGKGTEVIDLINREQQRVACEIVIPVDQLDSFLNERITRGVESYFSGMKNAFANNAPQKIHLLLAGNASRSKWVKAIFGETGESDLFNTLATNAFGKQLPKFLIHQPLEADLTDFNKPTAKTGVALGLLSIARGKIKLIKPETQDTGEAAFNHYVGRVKSGSFMLALKRGGDYQAWHELGMVNSDGEFYLYHTQSAQALAQLKVGDVDLKEELLSFVGDTEGHKVYVKAVSPNAIEVCSAVSLAAVQAGECENLQPITLS